MNPETQSKSLLSLPQYLRVVDVLDSLCGRDLRARLFGGIGRILVYVLATVLIRCLLDYWLQFAWSARVALLVADFLIVGWIVWKYLIRPLGARLNRNRAALRLQTHAPELRSQVIATIQLVPQADAGQAARPLVARLLDQTMRALDEVDWKAAVSIQSGARWLLTAVVIGLGGVAWALAFPNAASVLVSRYFLSQEPPLLDTRIDVVSGDMKVARGSQVHLVAELSGEVPAEVIFYLEDANRATEEFPVRSDETTPDTFALLVENAQESFNYVVSGGDARSRRYSVEVLDPPTLRGLEFSVRPPAYTGLDPYRVEGRGLRVVEGSELSVKGEATAELSEAVARLHAARGTRGEGVSRPEAVSPVLVEAAQFEGPIGVPGTETAAISVHLTGTNGVESISDTRHSIDWILDEAPEIFIETTPADNVSVATGRPVTIEGQVEDDYALSEVRLVWAMGEAEEATGSAVFKPAESGRFQLRLVTGRVGGRDGAIWVESIPGDEFRWWIEAVDNSGLPRGPQVGESSHRRIRVVTPEQKIAELMGRVRESMSTIEEVSDRQMDAGSRLRDLIQSESRSREETP